MHARVIALCAAIALAASSAACHKQSGAQAEVGADAGAPDAGGPPADPRLEELWARAKAGEADDLARLADREGSLGLQERAADPGARMTALRAAGFTGDLAALPWLSEVATSGTDDEAAAALQSALDLAAEPRRAVDPDDAIELRAGCDALLALARAADKPKGRRAAAISAIRMLADRGCATADQIPTDLDVK